MSIKRISNFTFYTLVLILFVFPVIANASFGAEEVMQVSPENINFEFNASEMDEIKNATIYISAEEFFHNWGQSVNYKITKSHPEALEQSFCKNINLIVDEDGGNDYIEQDGTGTGLLEIDAWWNPWTSIDKEDIWTIQASANNLKSGEYFCDLKIVVNDKSGGDPPIMLWGFVQTAYAQTSDEQEIHTVRITANIVGEKNGNSSVVFLPGIKASRLFIEGENQLWEPNVNWDVEKLKLNSEGESLSFGIYTKSEAKEGLVDEINVIPTGWENIYKSLIKDFDKMVEEGEIAQWRALPYDWRLSFDKILSGGRELDGKIYYGDDGDYILDSIRELAENSDSGKVTIVAHSMGGLLAKKVAQVLADNGEDIIDRIIFVATPQLGTPTAIGSLLHGYNEGKIWGLVIDESSARDLAYDMESAHYLLPSSAYTQRVLDVGNTNTKLIYFDNSLENLNSEALSDLDLNFRKFYGEYVFEYDELRKFLSGKENRGQPVSEDLRHPTKLREGLLQKAQEYHDFYDDWQVPSGIEISQIAGWGIPETVKGFRYVSRSKDVCAVPFEQSTCPFFVKKYYLSAEPIFTWDGDEVVVVPSAVAQGGDTYFVDLKKYNERGQGNVNRFHKNITEVDSVRNLIENIIIKKENPAEGLGYITQDQTNLKANNKLIRLAMHSPVDVHIYDEFGNHTGLLNAEDFEEAIPGSYYVEFAGSKYLGVPAGQNYRVELYGTDAGSFTFELKEMLGDTVTKKRTFSNLPVTLQTTSTINLNNLSDLNKLEIDIDGDGEIDEVYEPDEQTNDTRLETQLAIVEMIYDGNDILAQVTSELGDGFAPLLLSEFQGVSIDLESYTDSGKILPGQKKKLKLKIRFLESAGNEYKNKSVDINFKFNARQ